MKKLPESKVQVRFSAPDPQTNIINVSRVLPDGREESIGQVDSKLSLIGFDLQ